MTLIFGTICYQFLRSTDFKVALLGIPVFRKCMDRNFVLIFSVCFFLVPLFSGLKHVETMLMNFHVCILCNGI
jgi:hypothetical protein